MIPLHMAPPSKTQVLREHLRITEWREGCIWKTRSLGYVWVDFNTPGERGEDLFVSPSTRISKVHPTMRWVPSTTPTGLAAEGIR